MAERMHGNSINAYNPPGGFDWVRVQQDILYVMNALKSHLEMIQQQGLLWYSDVGRGQLVKLENQLVDTINWARDLRAKREKQLEGFRWKFQEARTQGVSPQEYIIHVQKFPEAAKNNAAILSTLKPYATWEEYWSDEGDGRMWSLDLEGARAWNALDDKAVELLNEVRAYDGPSVGDIVVGVAKSIVMGATTIVVESVKELWRIVNNVVKRAFEGDGNAWLVITLVAGIVIISTKEYKRRRAG